MTQVKDMKNVELNKALAELMGYKIKSTNTVPEFYRLIDPAGNTVVGETFDNELIVWAISAPQYCTNPVASLEVKAAAINAHEEVYMLCLAEVMDMPVMKIDNGAGDVSMYIALDVAAEMALATPRQRAEAAYMTLKEAQPS